MWAATGDPSATGTWPRPKRLSRQRAFLMASPDRPAPLLVTVTARRSIRPRLCSWLR